MISKLIILNYFLLKKIIVMYKYFGYKLYVIKLAKEV